MRWVGDYMRALTRPRSCFASRSLSRNARNPIRKKFSHRPVQMDGTVALTVKHRYDLVLDAIELRAAGGRIGCKRRRGAGHVGPDGAGTRIDEGRSRLQEAA